MCETAIHIKNLSKCYHIYNRPKDRLKQLLYPKLFGTNPKQYSSEFWALKDVSFEVPKGKTIGIVGQNGSGKSTLLQIICGTMRPTEGTITTNGRIAALLELGSGFNPAFSGKDNIYLYAAILGLSKKEVDAKFHDITAFADIGDFIDQPLKTYSSGMLVRLAFSVAINIDPDILIVDEALSVGDEFFQRKCFSKIEGLKNSGVTVLFVTHSGSTVIELCDQAIHLDAGEMLALGKPKEIIDDYHKLIFAPEAKRRGIRDLIKNKHSNKQLKESEKSDTQTNRPTEHNDSYSVASYDPQLKPISTIAYESHGALIEEATIFDRSGKKVNHLIPNQRYRYQYKVRFLKPAHHVRFGMLIKSKSGLDLGGAVSALKLDDRIDFIDANQHYKIEFDFLCSLNPGLYFLNAGVSGHINNEDTFLHRIIDIAAFRVSNHIEPLTTGIINFDCKPEVIKLDE